MFATSFWKCGLLPEAVTFWCGSGYPDPYDTSWLMDPDPTLDPTSFFSDFTAAKKLFLFHIFSFNLPTGILSSVLKFFFFLLKMLCKNFILQALCQSAQHIYEKREGSRSVPLTNGTGSVRPKDMRIRRPNTGPKNSLPGSQGGKCPWARRRGPTCPAPRLWERRSASRSPQKKGLHN